MKIIITALLLLLSNLALSNVIFTDIDDPFNYLLKNNGVFDEDYKERYHSFFNQDIQKDSEHWHEEYSYLIYQKLEGNLFEHPMQEQCDMVILDHNESIKEMNRGVDSFSIVCFYKGAVVLNIDYPTESLDFFGFDFSFVQINNIARIFYRPNLDNKEHRFMTSQIRKIIIEDIEKAFKFSKKEHLDKLSRKNKIKDFHSKLNLSEEQ